MRRRMVLISLVLAMVATILAPTTALAAGWANPGWTNPRAAQSFSSVMTPTAIDAPVVSTTPWPVATPANSNNWAIVDTVNGKPTIVGWLVDRRSVYAGVTGNLSGAGVFTYGGILDLLQSGSVHGNLVINTGGLNTLYLSADGNLAATVTEYYDFDGIAAWCQSAGIPVGYLFSQIYNADFLNIPDGNLTFDQLKAFSTAIGVPIVQFLYSIYGAALPAGLDEATLRSMYQGGQLPPIPGLALLKPMYGTSLPSLPKTMSADFSGTLNIETGTGKFDGANGQGKFSPYNKTPLTLHVSPAQHVQSIGGSIQLTGVYTTRTFQPRTPDLNNLQNLFGKWNRK